MGDDEHRRRRSRAASPRASAGRRRRGGWSARRAAGPSAPASSVPASSARACSPPESRASGVSGSRWSMASARRASSSARLQGPAAERLEALLRVAVALQGGGRRVALGQPRQQRAQLAAHRPQPRRARRRAARRASCAASGASCGSQPMRSPAPAATAPRSGRSTPGQQPQQRRLADAVGADEPGALAVAEHEREAVEERRAVVCLREIRCLQHGVLLRRAMKAGGLGARQARRATGRRARTPAAIRATARPSPRGRASPAGDRVRWLLTSPRRQRSARPRAPRSAATSPAQPQARVTPAPPWP